MSRRSSINLLTRDSGSMAASFSSAFVLRRQQLGPVEIVLIVHRHEVGGGREIACSADVEGPDWPAQFIAEAPHAVKERCRQLDADDILAGIAKLNKRLAAQTRTLLTLHENEPLAPSEARPFLRDLAQR